MCWLCDHPDATPYDYVDHLRTLITRLGWAVQGVERDRIHPPWAYTVGLTPRGLPELVVTGLPLRQATGLLNGVARPCGPRQPADARRAGPTGRWPAYRDRRRRRADGAPAPGCRPVRPFG